MKNKSSPLTPSLEIAAEVQPVRLTPLDERVLSCTFGHYPWDDWERRALAAGVAKDLAGLGRLTMREAYQHGWEAWLQNLCGWSDDGQALLDFALRAPRQARRQWDILMRTDGLRGDYPSHSTDWTWGFLRADARRLLVQLTTNERNHGSHPH